MNARKQQFGSQLRFFRQLCTAAKVPYVAELAKAALANTETEQCVVIGLQSTGARSGWSCLMSTHLFRSFAKSTACQHGKWHRPNTTRLVCSAVSMPAWKFIASPRKQTTPHHDGESSAICLHCRMVWHWQARRGRRRWWPTRAGRTPSLPPSLSPQVTPHPGVETLALVCLACVAQHSAHLRARWPCVLQRIDIQLPRLMLRLVHIKLGQMTKILWGV